MTNVGDEIEYGTPIPDDVLEMTDQHDSGEDAQYGPHAWKRARPGDMWRHMPVDEQPDEGQRGYSGDGRTFTRSWFPLTVTKVNRRVFDVPQAPDGVTRVKDRDGDRWEYSGDDGLWSPTSLAARAAVMRIHGSERWTWGRLLGTLGPVEDDTPREPRVWSKIDGPATDGVKVVEVEGHGRWEVTGRMSALDGEPLFRPLDGQHGAVRLALGRLRNLGEVREVLGE